MFSIKMALCPACSSRPKVNFATALKFSTVLCFEGFHLAQASVFQLAPGGCVSYLISVFNMGFGFLTYKSRLFLESPFVIVQMISNI